MEEFRKYFFYLDHFSPSFLGKKLKIMKFHPYSILTGEGKVDFLIYCMLRNLQANLLR